MTHRLDNRTVPCATGLIRAARTLDNLEPGAILEILSRDRFAPTEIALWADRDGHSVLEATRAGIWPHRYHRLLVRRGPRSRFARSVGSGVATAPRTPQARWG